MIEFDMRLVNREGRGGEGHCISPVSTNHGDSVLVNISITDFMTM